MRIRTMNAALATLTILCWGGAAPAAELALALEGIRSDSGRVMIAVFDRADAFRARTDAIATVRIRARRGRLMLSLGGLPPARYAVSVFHDENGDGALDTNLLGIPTEGYGFSNRARGTMGPPSFAEAAVHLGEDRRAVSVRLTY